MIKELKTYPTPEEITITPEQGEVIKLTPITGGFSSCQQDEILLFVLTKQNSDTETSIRLLRANTTLEIEMHREVCRQLRRDGYALCPVVVVYNTDGVVRLDFDGTKESILMDYSGNVGTITEVQ